MSVYIYTDTYCPPSFGQRIKTVFVYVLILCFNRYNPYFDIAPLQTSRYIIEQFNSLYMKTSSSIIHL